MKLTHVIYQVYLNTKMDQEWLQKVERGRTWRLYGSMTEYEEPEQIQDFQAREMAASATKMADIRNTAVDKGGNICQFFFK